MAYSDVQGEACLQGVCDKELGGHAWAGIEENTGVACVSWERIGRGQA